MSSNRLRSNVESTSGLNGLCDSVIMETLIPPR